MANAPKANTDSTKHLEAVQKLFLAMQNDIAHQGFSRKSMKLKSGDEVGYLEKPGADNDSVTLVGVHGFSVGPEFHIWKCGDKLAIPKGVRCIIPELPGHGTRIGAAVKSGKYKDWTVDEFADDLHVFLSELGVLNTPESKVDMFGFSLGAGVLLKFSEKHSESVRRMVLISPSVAHTVEYAESVKEGRSPFGYKTEEDTAKFLEIFGADSKTVTEMSPVYAKLREVSEAGVPADYWAACGTPKPTVLPASETDLDKVPDAAGLAGARALAKAGVPTLVIQPEKDRVHSVEAATLLKEAFDSNPCEFESLEGWGHFFHPNQPGVHINSVAYKSAAKFLGYVS